MAFQIKDFSSIAASIINHARATTKKITDWLPGSVARTLSEAPAIEIEELYLQFFNGLREAIPVATFRSFGFDKLPMAYAHGFVSVSTEDPPAEDETYAVGTEFSTDDGRKYLSTEEVVWPADEDSIRIPVAAAAAGLAYNVSAGGITQSPAFGEGYTISNSLIANGRDAETDTEREARFAEFVAALSGGTVPACTYAAKKARVLDADGNIYEYVTRVGISENPGFVRIYVYTSQGVPSAELLANGQAIIDGWRDEEAGTVTPGYRSGGVRVDLLAMTERAVPFTAQAVMLPGYTLTPAVVQDLLDIYADQLAALEPGGVLQIGVLEAALQSAAGVKAIIPAVGTANIVCDVFEVLKPGTFTITPP